jgi:hypothetical protein
MRKLLGIVLLGTPLALIIAMIASCLGLLNTLLILTASVLATFMIVCGIVILEDR